MVGSSGYTAPEILQGKNEPGEDVNMLRIIQGSPVEAALRHTHPVMKLARRMIAADPAARPTIDEVLAAPFPIASLLTSLHAICTELESVRKEKAAGECALRKAQAEVESVHKENGTLGRARRVFLVGSVYGDATCSGSGSFMKPYMWDGLTVGSIVFCNKKGTPSHPYSILILRHGIAVAWAPASSLAGAVGVGARITVSK